MFITLEGSEGSGKTTQSTLLAKALQEEGFDVIATHEPGGTRISQQIRRVLLDPANTGMTTLTELFLYLAARAQHIKEVIKPALEEGKIVICDRFIDATLAYQGYGRGLDKEACLVELIQKLNLLVIENIKPNLTFILDIDPAQGLKRAINIPKDIYSEGMGDRIEQEELEFHQRVREGYFEIARQEPQRVKIINRGKGIEETHQILIGYVHEILKHK
ncbi:MAG: dTMP kinase [bacterium]|nr:dTMP kinase [bacterium]